MTNAHRSMSRTELGKKILIRFFLFNNINLLKIRIDIFVLYYLLLLFKF